MGICSILNVMVAVTYPTIFSPRDVQIPEIRSLLAKTCFPHTCCLGLVSRDSVSLPQCHRNETIDNKVIVLSAGLVFPEYFYSFLHGYFKQFSVVSLLTPDQCIQK